MFEYHGWVTIGDSATGDDDAALLERLVDRVGRAIRDFADFDLLDLRWVNGVPVLHLGGLDKHGSTVGPELIDLFTRVGELAPGSYGLLHVWDDQDPLHDNEFRVHRMARGQVVEQADTHLSPVTPTLLDGYEF
ncbi:immunity 7 family protein [Amycolatopsis sp. H20-H5]|uniref:immunity 7 family protein n=1 Tax=Amycolatopsis sp. H20-H5 TaxID=3046309 RepID=UPI002DBF712A|nr:immunity 7 family protein [Amycolatopsis sp. H20-H5]MEC3981425.1 immunity 7 family protein [Amycolatopsis sp. H20-H5]